MSEYLEIASLLLIPFTAAIVGWGTNILALKMTFYPLTYWGIWPIGWQGIIPAQSENMARKAVDLWTKELIDIDEMVAQIDPSTVAQEMKPAMEQLAKNLIDELILQKFPKVWRKLPALAKKQVYKQVEKQLPQIVQQIIEEVNQNIPQYLDIQTFIYNELTKDKALLNEIFLKCGESEFRFIERSGIYFGFLFGFIQMGIWFLFPNWWLLPLGGLIIGYLTNILALRLIFQPLKPIKIGPFVVQALFVKRQKEVAIAYAAILSEKILSTPKIFQAILEGKGADRLLDLISENVNNSIDDFTGKGKSTLEWALGQDSYESIKLKACERIADELPFTIKHTYEYVDSALNVEETLRTNMAALSPEEFTGFLRPVFQEDEWKLILVGAILGAVAGVIQLSILA